MGKVHLAFEELSALLDGELGHSDESQARAHLSDCERCATELASLSRLETALVTSPLIPCPSSIELRSALVDSELSAAEAQIASAHLAGCESCCAEQATWTSAETALRAMPAALPSARVDAAMRRLMRRPLARPAFRPVPRIPAGGLRVAATVAVVLAVLIGLLPGAAGPEQAQQEISAGSLVAGVHLVLYGPTNTYYVLQPSLAAVDAVAADTYQLRTRISVGGRPSALALNEAAARVLVLDSTAKSITEIDANSYAVLSTTDVPISGTPTSMLVEPSSGRIVVASIPNEGGSGSGPVATPRSGGEVAVLDGSTKKLEVLVNVDTAPELVVTDPQGKTALLVSTRGTTLVDKTYKTLRKLPGGVSAVYGTTGWIAILGGGFGAVLTIVGDGAPEPVHLTGAPRAVTAMPDGGFAVLIGSGKLDSRIVVIDAAGVPVGITALDQPGSDLTFDSSSKRFAVVADGRVASAPLPSGLALGGQPKPAESIAPPSSVPASSSPATAPSSSAPSSLPSAAPSSAPALALPTASPAVPPGATLVSPGLYRVALGNGRVPVITAKADGRIWFLDQQMRIGVLDTVTGATYFHQTLPQGATITALAAGPSALYAVDGSHGRLFTFSVRDEQLAEVALPLVDRNVTATVAPDGVLWLGGRGGALLRYEPSTGRVDAVNLGIPSIAAVAADVGGHVWFSDGSHFIGRYDTLSGQIDSYILPGRGVASVVLPDLFGRLWIGTSVGDVYSVQAGELRLARRLDQPVAALALGLQGQVWFLAPAGQQAFVLTPLASEATPKPLPGAASDVSFNARGRAWLADPTGGFLLLVEGAWQ